MKPDNVSVSGNRPFFIPGGTLPGDAPSYVVRQADHNLLEGLRSGQFCYVLTSRQMGKSSLMVRTANRLREEGVAVAVLDLTALGQNLSVEQWYFGLLEQLGRHLRLEDELDDYWQSHKSLGPMQRWMAAIRDVVLRSRSQQIVVFVDEIDIVRSLPFSTDEFFAAIRECYNRRAQEPQYARLTFCLLGVATPNDLIKNTLMTPFNIGRRIELTDFTSEEAAPLSAGISMTERDEQALLNQSLYWTGGNPLLNRVLYWTGGHPYLTQRLCKLVAEDTKAVWDEDVDRLCANLFLAHKAIESDTNLQFVRDRLLQSEVDLTALLDLYARARQNARVADDETNPLTSILKLSGIVRVERGELKVRNRIYTQVFDREWVRAHIPGAELRRQRIAYRQGLVRALALSSAVLVVFVGLAMYGFLQARRANHNAALAHIATMEAQKQADTAERASYIARMNLIQRDWEINDFSGVTNLLEDTRQSRFRGFEWGYWNRLSHIELLSLHTGAHAVAYSPDGKRIVTGYGKTASIWDAATGQEILTLKGHKDTVSTIMYSSDGKRIVTGSWDNTAKVWDATTGQETLTFKGHTAHINSAAFSPDGKYIVTAGSFDNTVKVWNASTGQERLTIKGDISNALSAAYSPDGKRIVTGSNNVKVWDAATGREILTLKGDTHDPVAYSPDGKHIITGGGYDAHVCDAETGREVLTFKGHTSLIASAAYSPDGKHVVTGSYDKTARVWDVVTGQEIFIIKGHTATVASVAYSPDGKHIITGGDDAKIWDAVPHETLTLNVDTGSFLSVAYSPDSKRIMTRSSNLQVWNAATGRESLTIKGNIDWVRYWNDSVAYSPDGKRIVAGSVKTAKVWDATTGREILTLKGHTSLIAAAVYSPDGKRIITGSWDKTAKVWDAETGLELLTLKGHIDRVRSVAYSPDGKRIVTGSADATAKVWDAATGQEILTLKGHTDTIHAVAYSPDGKRIVTGSWDKTAKIWYAETGQEMLTLRGHTNEVTSVAYSPDGKRIVTGSTDETAKVWDVATGQETLTLKGDKNSVNSVTFSPDGKRIVAAFDLTVKVWYSDGADYPKTMRP